MLARLLFNEVPFKQSPHGKKGRNRYTSNRNKELCCEKPTGSRYFFLYARERDPMREPVGLNRLKTSWEKRPEAHLNLWRRLRARGRQVRVVAVAWEPSLLTRVGKVLAAWGGKDSRDEDAPDTLRKAIGKGDWETIEQHGGLNEVMSRIGKRADGGRIDGFTLWWPERCRQIGAHSTKGT